MTRVRTDSVFGTLTDNPLTDSATTMNSAGLANLAAVSSAEAIIVLDPNRVSGAPEIVVVTAHTGSATSATIVRGQFGTSAREHAAGTEWVHGPIASNATSYATAADDQGDFVPMGAWESWTPTLANLTLGDGSVNAKFVRYGRTICYRFKFKLGSTSAVGTSPTFTLPVAAHADYVALDGAYGFGFLRDAGTNSYPAVVRIESATVAGFFTGASPVTGITSTAPFTWATNDVLFATGTYEAAS